MKSPNSAPSATSLPRAPREDASARFTKYMVTMGIRVACFVAMVLITPYGWYTWVLGAAAVVLPYFAVVVANVGEDTKPAVAERPERQIEAPRVVPEVVAEDAPRVLRIRETPRPDTDR